MDNESKSPSGPQSPHRLRCDCLWTASIRMPRRRPSKGVQKHDICLPGARPRQNLEGGNNLKRIHNGVVFPAKPSFTMCLSRPSRRRNLKLSMADSSAVPRASLVYFLGRIVTDEYPRKTVKTNPTHTHACTVRWSEQNLSVTSSGRSSGSTACF